MSWSWLPPAAIWNHSLNWRGIMHSGRLPDCTASIKPPERRVPRSPMQLPRSMIPPAGSLLDKEEVSAGGGAPTRFDGGAPPCIGQKRARIFLECNTIWSKLTRLDRIYEFRVVQDGFRR